MKMHSTTSNFLENLNILNRKFQYVSLNKAEKILNFDIKKLPFCYRILLENLIRKIDGKNITKKDLKNLINFDFGKEIFFSPSRVLMQDYTGVPAIADLAAMRDKIKEKGRDPKIINPKVPVSLVIDHSVSVDSYSKQSSLEINVKKEYSRNKERYMLLKWAQKSLENFTLFPPGSGICHQINVEYLADIVSQTKDILFLDSVVGTDSHTTMVNALSVLGWGVGGIEAEAVMLGQPISMQIPEIVGVRISGVLKPGVTATDVVLTITETLRKLNVVGKFVEFFGPGIKSLTLSERSTISNMAPEYGATCGLFPIDNETLKYLEITGRKKSKIEIVEIYAKKQNLWHEENYENINYTEIVEIKLGSIESSLSGPKRPQDRIKLGKITNKYFESLNDNEKKELQKFNKEDQLNHGKVCIAAITSCTNTSNPSVLLMAGLIAKKALDFGIKVPWWVKTSFAPGSKVVEKYLDRANLIEPLNGVGFNIVGYGCTTCIGNSGPLDQKVSDLIEDKDLNVCSVISGNRNFEGRIHPLIKSNFLTSPPLVVMFAIAGRVNINIKNEKIAQVGGKEIFFEDLWPSNEEVNEIMEKVLTKDLYEKNYKGIFKGDENWRNLRVKNSSTYEWSLSSTYIKKPPFLDNHEKKSEKIINARPLLILGDSITTDHISPAGAIKENSQAGKYLMERQVNIDDFNSYGARRGNHEIMVRGTFANIRIKNQMVDDFGGYTKHYPTGNIGEIHKIAKMYESKDIPLIVVAGKEYGTGSSRDWAAKGTKLLGIRVVIAESFERIHRSNLVGMGVLPLQFSNVRVKELNLKGNELFDIGNLEIFMSKPNIKMKIKIKFEDGSTTEVRVESRIDTFKELKYFKKDGILPFVLDKVNS